MSQSNLSKSVQTAMQNFTAIEAALIHHDLSRLSPPERLEYYRRVCESVGLNPLTRPFIYVQVQQRLVLYPTADAAYQFSNIYGLTTEVLSRSMENELCVVEVRVTKPNGQSSMASGVVPLIVTEYEKTKVKPRAMTPGEKANAMMKAETKARRRAILSLVGLSRPPEYLDYESKQEDNRVLNSGERSWVDPSTGVIHDKSKLLDGVITDNEYEIDEY